jgi:hypothetical protein
MANPLGLNVERLEPFKILLHRFSELAEQDGVKVSPNHGDQPTCFLALPPEKQTAVLENFSRYLQVCEEAASHRESLSQNRQLLWRMFSRLGVHPTSDLMDHIDNKEVIEIYDADYVQIFRNLKFFEFCSYTLDELLCRPFWELFRRDETLTPKLLERTAKVFSGEIQGVHWWKVGLHAVDEIESPSKYRGIVEYRLISPLFDSAGKIISFVNTFEILSYTKMVP